MSAELIAAIVMGIAAAVIIAVFGIGVFSLWLLLAAVAAPFIGKAFDTNLDDDDWS